MSTEKSQVARDLRPCLQDLDRPGHAAVAPYQRTKRQGVRMRDTRQFYAAYIIDGRRQK